MPKLLFYSGTAFCVFLALSSAASAWHDFQTGATVFVALGGGSTARAAWAIVVALLTATAVATILLRMAALVAARNLFAAFVALFAVAGSLMALVWVLMLEARMLREPPLPALADFHLAGVLGLAYFVSLTMLALRPYFRVQASRMLSLLVFLPLPLMILVLLRELFVAHSRGPLPSSSPALVTWFAILAVLFFAIAVHSIRHRYLFLEMTNLRELLDSRADLADRAARRTIGGVAFDS